LISANSEETVLRPEDILSVIEYPDESADEIDVDSDNDGWFGPESKAAAVSRSPLGDGIDDSDNDEMLE
jgi:hypothetical protein